jgi:hypothetical protein
LVLGSWFLVLGSWFLVLRSTFYTTVLWSRRGDFHEEEEREHRTKNEEPITKLTLCEKFHIIGMAAPGARPDGHPRMRGGALRFCKYGGFE